MPKNLSDIITPEVYFKELTTTFPEIAEKVDIEDGYHFKMERFADYTIIQIWDTSGLCPGVIHYV